MRKPFSEALGDLLVEYRDADWEEVASALECELMALEECHGNESE